MYQDSDIDPIGLGLVNDQQGYTMCHLDGNKYPDEEMVFDKDGGNYLHFSNIDNYMKDFERDMLYEDYINLLTNLKNQIR